MGRPTITLTPDQVREIETLAALLSVQQIADYLGIARSTFFALLERDPDIARRYRRGKAKAVAHVANGLLQKARSGDNAAMFFFLKTQGGWRETARIEADNPDYYQEQLDVQPGGPMIDVTCLSDSALAEVAALYDDSHAPEPNRPRQGLIRRY